MAQEKMFPSGGHNTNDPGAVSDGFTEFEIVQDINNRVVALAKAEGYNYETKAVHESNRTYQSRIKPVKGDVIADLHMNASNDPTSTGLEVYISRNAGADSKAMAKEASEGLSQIIGIRNRGVKTEGQSQHNTIGILNKSGTAILVELGFINNPEDRRKVIAKKQEIACYIYSLMKKYDRNK